MAGSVDSDWEDISSSSNSDWEDISHTPQAKSFIGKVWDALDVPAQTSKRGLTELTDSAVGIQNYIADKTKLPLGTEPTGNLPADIYRNTGRIAGETMAEVAPTFINRASILTSGALKGAQMATPAIKAAGGYAAGQLEQLAGAVPGSLSEAAKDATLMFGRGKKAVQSLYEAAKNAGVPIRQEISEALDHKDVVERAYSAALDGTLNPSEALVARKSLGKMYRRISSEAYNYYRNIFDPVAKEAFAIPDQEYQKAIMSESLRNLLPQNKLGGASSFKTALVGLLNAEDAGMTKKLISAAFSPAVQGAGATGLGLLARRVAGPLAQNPQLGLLAGQLINDKQGQ